MSKEEKYSCDGYCYGCFTDLSKGDPARVEMCPRVDTCPETCTDEFLATIVGILIYIAVFLAIPVFLIIAFVITYH